jgi:hypothetical protein
MSPIAMNKNITAKIITAALITVPLAKKNQRIKSNKNSTKNIIAPMTNQLSKVDVEFMNGA